MPRLDAFAKPGIAAPGLQEIGGSLDLPCLQSVGPRMLDRSEHQGRGNEPLGCVDDVANGQGVPDHERTVLGSPEHDPQAGRVARRSLGTTLAAAGRRQPR